MQASVVQKEFTNKNVTVREMRFASSLSLVVQVARVKVRESGWVPVSLLWCAVVTIRKKTTQQKKKVGNLRLHNIPQNPRNWLDGPLFPRKCPGSRPFMRNFSTKKRERFVVAWAKLLFIRKQQMLVSHSHQRPRSRSCCVGDCPRERGKTEEETGVKWRQSTGVRPRDILRGRASEGWSRGTERQRGSEDRFSGWEERGGRTRRLAGDGDRTTDWAKGIFLLTKKKKE